jgi:hypothetical protein
MPVRNEDWILALSARVALQWCDALIIGTHDCTDGSMSIVQELMMEFPRRVLCLQQDHGEWREMEHRKNLLHMARNYEATHISIIDADEVLTANLIPRVRSLVEGTPRGQILQLPLYNLRGGIGTYHANGLWGNRIVSVAFADDPALHWGGDRFHHREPMGRKMIGFCPVSQGDGGVLHFWGASERRLKAKHALYKVTEALRWPEKPIREIDRTYSMWRDGTRMGGENPMKWEYTSVQHGWLDYRFSAHSLAAVDLGGVPWQEAEVKRLIAEHGRERFAGLDLFGVDA